MVRAPARTCPNLSRLFDECEPDLLAALLGSKIFQRFEWLDQYGFNSEGTGSPIDPSKMLNNEKKDRLAPLEAQAARISKMASNRGEYVLEGLARTKLEQGRAKELLTQRDRLARSLWTFVHEHGLFEAAENGLDLRLYRRYDKH
ncbi:hypothetical protein [Henriciella pelagia]|jgi:hypothetical protein|uniref:hypothetical protein n=1 Tax=Henriciella pelagia TaxID=1977912 RepID=UPI003515CC0B